MTAIKTGVFEQNNHFVDEKTIFVIFVISDI